MFLPFAIFFTIYKTHIVIPPQGGIQFAKANLRYFALLHRLTTNVVNWIPACAGMTSGVLFRHNRAPRNCKISWVILGAGDEQG